MTRGDDRSPVEGEFELLRRRVTAAVRRNCPDWLREQAEDIVQNVLMKLYKMMETNEGNREFTSVYLEKSAYGAVVDEIRRVCRRRENPVGDGTSMERRTMAASDPDRETRSLDIAWGILDCLRQQSGPRRLALTFYLQGCTVPETARHLRWTAKKTENLVYRGLADLRRCLAGKGLQP